MYCGNCGKEINDKNKFCPVCGNRIRQDVQEETKEQFVTVVSSAQNSEVLQPPLVPEQNSVASTPEVTEPPVQIASAPVLQPPAQTIIKEKKKPSKKLFLIIGAVVLAAILIAAGIFLFANSGKAQTPSKTIKQFKAVYSDSDVGDFSYFYDIVEQDGYRIYKWTEYDSETNKKTHETVYKYDDENNTETRFHYDEDGILYGKNVYTLSNDGRYESCAYYEIVDGEESFCYEYYFVGLDMVGKFDVPDDYAFVEYDEYNRIVIWEDYYSDGSWYKTAYEYDQNGRISETTTDYTGYEYSYTLTPVS